MLIFIDIKRPSYGSWFWTTHHSLSLWSEFSLCYNSSHHPPQQNIPHWHLSPHCLCFSRLHSLTVLWCAPGTLFTTYLLPLGNSFTNSVFHLTAPQMTLSPNSPTRRLPNSQDTNCFNEVRSCFPSNFFIFNSNKTELIFMSFPPANHSPLPLTFRLWVSSSVAHWFFTGTWTILPSPVISTYALIVSACPPHPLCTSAVVRSLVTDQIDRPVNMTKIPFSSAYWTNPYLHPRAWSKTQMLASVLSPTHFIHSFICPIATALAPNHGQNRPKDPPVYIQGHPQPCPSLSARAPPQHHLLENTQILHLSVPTSRLTPTWCLEHELHFLN